MINCISMRVRRDGRYITIDRIGKLPRTYHPHLGHIVQVLAIVRDEVRTGRGEVLPTLDGWQYKSNK